MARPSAMRPAPLWAFSAARVLAAALWPGPIRVFDLRSSEDLQRSHAGFCSHPLPEESQRVEKPFHKRKPAGRQSYSSLVECMVEFLVIDEMSVNLRRQSLLIVSLVGQ